MGLTPDPMKLTEEQRQALETYQQREDQLQALEDIAKMTQEVVNILDDKKKDKGIDNLGTLLVDIREQLSALKDKEAPETPDYAKPIVEAVSRLEKALSASIKAIDVKPQVKVDAPAVNVSPNVDLKGVEKALGSMPSAFEKAIKLIPKTEVPETDFTPLLEAWQGISEQLASIDTATRMKPVPGKMNVTNPDGSAITPKTNTSSQDSRTIGTTPAVILSPNTNRIGATIYNEGTAVCYMKLGTDASTTSYTLQIANGGYYELPYRYTGPIEGVTSSSTALLRVTEIA